MTDILHVKYFDILSVIFRTLCTCKYFQATKLEFLCSGLFRAILKTSLG